MPFSDEQDEDLNAKVIRLEEEIRQLNTISRQKDERIQMLEARIQALEVQLSAKSAAAGMKLHINFRHFWHYAKFCFLKYFFLFHSIMIVVPQTNDEEMSMTSNVWLKRSN